MNLLIHHNGVYNVWSSVIDAPIFECGLTLEQLKSVAPVTESRLRRVHATGCSCSLGSTLDDCIRLNKAGPDEEHLTREAFIAKYLTLPQPKVDRLAELEREHFGDPEMETGIYSKSETPRATTVTTHREVANGTPQDWEIFSFLERVRDDLNVPAPLRERAGVLHTRFATRPVPLTNEKALAVLSDADGVQVDASSLLACPDGMRPRPLAYSLSDYHRAPSEGPLHFTWQDKPHRLLYDLIAALAYYHADDVKGGSDD